MITSVPAYKATFQGKYYMTLFATHVSATHTSGDHYYESDRGATHFEGIGSIHDNLYNPTTIFKFWAPCSRLKCADQNLGRAIFGFDEAWHSQELALDLVSPTRHKEVLDWIVEGILVELKDKAHNRIYLGCLSYKEFGAKFCPECAVA